MGRGRSLLGGKTSSSGVIKSSQEGSLGSGDIPDALHPVNTDVQAPQIAASYLDDIEDVAAAKAAFLAAFDDAAAGGLAAKQAPAPVHVLPEPAPLVAAPVAAPIVAAPA